MSEKLQAPHLGGEWGARTQLNWFFGALLAILTPVALCSSLGASETNYVASEISATPYIGAGTMPLNQAIRFIEPKITKINYPAKFNSNTRVQWGVAGDVGDAFTQIFAPLNIEWSISGSTISLHKIEIMAKDRANIDAALVDVDIQNSPLKGAVKPKFEITSEDETLYLALRRWAVDSGYQLVWDAGKDFPAKKTSYQVDHFEDAVAKVMGDTGRSSYPLHACSYTNNVVRILPVSQSCERKEGR